MKKKNLIIGLGAFAFAICSAFTTVKVKSKSLVEAYIELKMNVADDYTCEDSYANCENLGGYICQVAVFSSKINAYKTVIGNEPDTECAVRLNHSSPSPVYSPLVVYDAR